MPSNASRSGRPKSLLAAAAVCFILMAVAGLSDLVDPALAWAKITGSIILGAVSVALIILWVAGPAIRARSSRP